MVAWKDQKVLAPIPEALANSDACQDHPCSKRRKDWHAGTDAPICVAVVKEGLGRQDIGDQVHGWKDKFGYEKSCYEDQMLLSWTLEETFPLWILFNKMKSVNVGEIIHLIIGQKRLQLWLKFCR